MDDKLDQLCQFLENGMYTPEMFSKRRDALLNEKKELEHAIDLAKKNCKLLEVQKKRL